MIYSVRGELIVSEPGVAVVECSGVGLRCFVSMNTLAALPPRGSQVMLFTHLAVREDAQELYGFLTTQERDHFRLLLGVGGVGPRVALSILSDLSGERLQLAVAGGDAKLLTRCQGVGPKLAQRIILELKDKMGSLLAGEPGLPARTGGMADAGALGEAVTALEVLGYSQAEAAAALRGCEEGMPVQEMIKRALKILAGQG